MDKKMIGEFAQALFDAEQSHQGVQPLTERNPAFNVDAAYEVQMKNVSRAQGMGYQISGKKIGLTSLPMQKQMGVGEPDYGHLFEAMECKDGCINTEVLIQPKIEAELAFVLKKDLRGGSVTVADVDEATEYVVGAFEIVDSRVADWRIKLPDTIADNASSGRYVLGQTRITPKSIDLAAVAMKLYKMTYAGDQAAAPAGQVSSAASMALLGEGTGAAVMGDPRMAVAWLANKLWDYGVELKAGEVVLSGAFSAAPAAQKGDVFRVDFTDFGSVEARFV
ncbi:MAG: fumarylacetoacetate hydrolase family protein [Peptococcaceae bacterium]|nr:fumarylacetoacetate hydrolase family protein [Peptococcaceae bacterium]